MRELVRFEEERSARTFGDVLFVDGVENHVDEARDGRFVVWVRDERQLEHARQRLQEFEAAPHDPRFEAARDEARRRRKAAERDEKKDRHRTVRVRERWATRRGTAPLTLGLIVLSCAVTVPTLFESGPTGHIPLLSFAAQGGWNDVLGGQLWRLVTPIFIHYGVLHLAFNMLWLQQLGSMIEHRQSIWFFGALALLTGIVANVLQFEVTGSPRFGGMSGVVYALFGYIWVRGRLDPASGYGLPKSTVVILLGWFVLCFTPIIPNIANTAHAAGLGGGVVWAAAASGLRRRKR